MKHSYMWLRVAMTALLMGTVCAIQAATRTWTGTVDTDYATGANWEGGTAPVDNNYSDEAKFKENGPANKTPDLASSREVKTITFENSVGWTVTGSQILLRVINSSGIGTNSINKVKSYKDSDQKWTIGAGNTLLLSDFYLDGSSKTVTIQGGGTLVCNTAIDGYSSGRRLKITDGTLRVNESTPFKKDGAAIIASKLALVELKTNVATAKSWIGNRILDDTGMGLAVTSIGDDFVRISVAILPTFITIR